MALHKNLVKITISNAPGTSGALTVSSAVAGFLGFGPSDDGKSFILRIEEPGVGVEVRASVYTHSTTSLSRGTLEVSTTGSAINLTSAAIVSVIVSAGWLNQVELQLDRGFTHVANAGTTQSLSSGTNTKVAAALDSVIANPKGWWSTANKRFLPDRAGVYYVLAIAQVAYSSPGQIFQANLYKNGANDTPGMLSDAQYQVCLVDGPIYLNGSTDYVELYVYANTATTTQANANCLFKAIYMGP